MILNGEYDLIRSSLQTNSAATTDPANLWILAKTEFLAENYSVALEILRGIPVSFPDTLEAERSWFLMAEILYTLERYDEAIVAYQNYQATSTLFKEYVLTQLANCYSLTGKYDLAIETYKKVLENDPSNETIQIKIGRAYLFSERPDKALDVFNKLFEVTGDDYTKAQLDLLSGQALINQGNATEGYDKWRHGVENYPLAFDSYTALSGLVNDEQPVNDFNRGLVDYYAGQYDVALTAFSNYLSSTPENDGTVHYYIGLIQRDSGNYPLALEAFTTLIENYPENRFWASAWDEKATTLWAYMDDYDGGARILEEYSTLYQGTNLAASYLLEAGRIRERNKELDRASQLWEALPIQFPDSADRYTALMYAGVTRYRLGENDKALENFQNALQISKDDPEIIKANFWVGKTYKSLGSEPDAEAYWQKTIAMDPIGYYGLRANELINGQQPFLRRDVLNDEVDIIQERNEAATWIKLTLNLPAETDILNLGALQDDIHFVQGLEYWNLGYFEQAKVEFDLLSTQYAADPVNLFRLGNYLVDIGLYKSGIQAIRDVLTLLGYEDHYQSINVPAYFNHIRYGLYYYELVKKNALEYGIDPLFVMSVMRQESLFEGFIHSSAGARGLMQIMPATGESIAQQMGISDGFTIDQLYQPNISISLGTYYLNSNNNYLDNDMYAVLAAYNAGPGNASIWQSLSNGDQDVEVEVIRYGEPRDYIKSIYETYYLYQKIYSIRN
jgi:soluble lytic murein transglycosylase